MADLLDIMPQTAVEIVKIDGHRIKLYPISIPAMVTLISRFPKLKDALNNELGDNLVLRLFEGVGIATPAIIAAACGHLGNAEYEQSMEKLLPEHQLKLLSAAVVVTFPNGFGPFLEQLNKIMSGGEGAKVIKVRLRPSRSILPPSSEPDSHPTMQ
jgi:hypothetical protein